MENKKIIAFDLDDVICYREIENNSVKKYESCKPITKMIDIVNKCYDDGYEIIIYTARGMKTLDGDIEKIYNILYPLTKKHLDSWGVKYHKLVMGKIHYDVLIDDKAINSLRVKDSKSIYRFLHKSEINLNTCKNNEKP